MTRSSRRPHTTAVPGDVDSALSELGIEVERTVAGEHWAKCPAHAERTGKGDHTASWSVNEDTGQHHCFSCGYSGSFVALVGYLHSGDAAAATEWVRARGGIERARAKLAKAEAPAPAKRAPITEASLALYTAPPARALAQRHLSAESAHHYGVRWDPEKAAWILPIREPHTDALLGWQEKSERIFRNRPYGVKKSQTLFGYDCFEGEHSAVLVESPLDCLRLRTAGVAGGLATYGASVSDQQMTLLLRASRRLVVALDNDDAGHRAAEEILLRWSNRGLLVSFWDYPRGVKDPGDMDDRAIREAMDASVSSILWRA